MLQSIEAKIMKKKIRMLVNYCTRYLCSTARVELHGWRGVLCREAEGHRTYEVCKRPREWNRTVCKLRRKSATEFTKYKRISEGKGEDDMKSLKTAPTHSRSFLPDIKISRSQTNITTIENRARRNDGAETLLRWTSNGRG